MVNDSFRNSYGYELKEVLQADFSIINANPGKVPDLIVSICESGSVLFETMHRTKEGEEFPVEVHSHCVRANGNVIVVSIIRNISDRKRDQSELFQMQEARSKTLKLMSHDLRNCLAQIASALVLLNEYNFEKSIQDLINILSEANKNANHLLLDHLSSSDDPSDSFKLDILPFDLSELNGRLASKYFK